MAKKVPKGLKELFDESEKLDTFNDSSLIEGTIEGKKVKVMHHKIKGKTLYSYKVNDYRFSPPMSEKQIKTNLSGMKKAA